MPELPEVETTLRGIAPYIEHDIVKNIIIRQPKLRWPIPANLSNQIKKQYLQRISRRAKYLLFDFPTGTMILHLGMSGRLSILTEKLPAKKHDHLDIEFQQGHILRFTDPRRFGAILFTEEKPDKHPLICSIGIEPLSIEFTGKYLQQQLTRRQIAIKSCLLNSHIVAGIGNIYATESLFIAGIDPRKPAATLSIHELNQLVKAIKSILKIAIAKGGTTLKDFLGASGSPGYFSQQLKAYGNANQPCPKCHEKLQMIRIAARATVYCPICQR